MRRQPEPLHVDFHLLDRQLVDADGRLVGNVDDVELDDDLRVVALLSGQVVLGERMRGRLGRLLAATARRLAPEGSPEPVRIPYDLVDDVGSEIRLVAGADRPDPPLETWLGEHLIGRIPGAGRAGE